MNNKILLKKYIKNRIKENMGLKKKNINENKKNNNIKKLDEIIDNKYKTIFENVYNENNENNEKSENNINKIILDELKTINNKITKIGYTCDYLYFIIKEIESKL